MNKSDFPPSTPSNPYHLTRFLKAQSEGCPRALSEIQNGHKETHRILYIFPQLVRLCRDYHTYRFA